MLRVVAQVSGEDRAMDNENNWKETSKRNLGRRRLLGGTALGSAALLLAGCSNSRRGGATQGASSSGASGKPQLGGTINLRMTTDPFDWDISYAGKSFPNGY